METMELTPRHSLIPWLIPRIDQGGGVSWQERCEGLFRVDWPRVGNRTRADDFLFFRDWARHQGLIGIEETPNLRRCKDNIRSVFGKSKYIKQMKISQRSCTYRLYKIVGKNIPPTQDAAPDTTTYTTGLQSGFANGGDIGFVDMDASGEYTSNCSSDHILPHASIASSQSQMPYSPDSVTPNNAEVSTPIPLAKTTSPPTTLPDEFMDTITDPNELTHIIVKYCGVQVDVKPASVSNVHGCHVYYSDQDICSYSVPIDPYTDSRKSQVYGDGYQYATRLKLPNFYIPENGRHGPDSHATLIHGQKRLESLHRGLRVSSQHGDIYVTRFSKARIHYMSQDTGGVPRCIDRPKDDKERKHKDGGDRQRGGPIKVFDLAEFEMLVRRYKRGETTHAPHPYVYLACAQDFCVDLRIQIIVYSQRAMDLLREVASEVPSEVDFSHLQRLEGSTLMSRTDDRDIDALVMNMMGVNLNLQ